MATIFSRPEITGTLFIQCFGDPPSADALCRNYYTQVLQQEPDNLAQQLMFGALSELAKQ